MPSSEHHLERRVHALAGRLKGRVTMLTESLMPANKRPLFSEQLSKRDALIFHSEHRYDPNYADFYKSMGIGALLELDQALAQANEKDGFDGTEEDRFSPI